MQNRIPLLALLALIASTLIWAGSFVVLKVAYRSYDPMFVIFARMAVAALCFLFFFRSFKKNTYRKGDWKLFALLGLFEPCLYFLLEGWALAFTAASQAGMIVAMLPLFVALAARVFLQERITRRTLLGFALAVLGATWLSASSSSTQAAPNPVLGNMLEVLAIACAAGYTIVIKKLSYHYTPLLLTAYQAVIGTLFFFPVMLASGEGIPAHFDMNGAISILYLGVAVTMGAYGFFNYSISRIPANQASAFVNLIPVFTVLMGWAFLGETFSSPQYIASALVLSGVFISQDRQSKAAPDESKTGLTPQKEGA